MSPLQWVGLIPGFFFAMNAHATFVQGRIGDNLWICHVANLLLMLGLLFRRDSLTRMGALYTTAGAPYWIIGMIWLKSIFWISAASHLAGIAVGLYAVKKIGAEKSAWIPAFIFYLLLQQICRVLTPAKLNVNYSHSILGGFEYFFSGYGAFWAATAVLAGLSLWLAGSWHRILFSAERP